MKPIHVGYAVVAAVALFFLMPPETKVSMAESWRRLLGDPGQACFDFQRDSLNDPITARLGSYVTDPISPDQITITYYARNALGAYTQANAICVVKSGKVEVPATNSARKIRALDDSIKSHERELDDGIKCLKDKIAKHKAGQPVSSLPCPGQ